MKASDGLLSLSAAILLGATAAASGAGPPCHRNAALEALLAEKTPEWASRLAQISGYEHPGPLSVCQVAGGRPRSDGERIYLPPLRGDEELLSLAHEYVHLAFHHHPSSRNEGFVERMARALVLGEEQE